METKQYNCENPSEALEYLKEMAKNHPANGMTIREAAEQLRIIDVAYETVLKEIKAVE